MQVRKACRIADACAQSGCHLDEGRRAAAGVRWKQILRVASGEGVPNLGTVKLFCCRWNPGYSLFLTLMA